jgi:hypothetical protein
MVARVLGRRRTSVRRLIVIAFAALTLGNAAPPAPTCSHWISQTNGMSWRVCTDAQGQRYCEIKVARSDG